jgi:hypothetical protein
MVTDAAMDMAATTVDTAERTVTVVVMDTVAVSRPIPAADTVAVIAEVR